MPMILLRSSDGDLFEVERAVAEQSETIKLMIEEGCDMSNGIPLPNVTSKILSLVTEYCKSHVDALPPKPDTLGPPIVPTNQDRAKTFLYGETNPNPAAAAKLKKWDAEFVKVDRATLFELIKAANYLNIKSLLDLTCQTVADEMIEGKTPKQIRKNFNIKNDFTPEEEAEVRKKNAWAYV